MGGRVSKRSGPATATGSGSGSESESELLKQQETTIEVVETVEDPLKTASPAQASPESPASRKRRRTETGATGAVNANSDRKPTKRARLTRKNLAQLEKMHRPSKKSKGSKSTTTGTEATPASEASEASEASGASGATRVTTTSTTASGFGVLAMTNGILDPDMSKPPANLEALRARQARQRESASPPASAYHGYVNKVKGASNEATMVAHANVRLLKQDDSLAYQSSYNQAFTAFPKNVGFNNDMSAPQPDFVEGLTMREFFPCPVHLQVPGAVLYKDGAKSITLPHIAGEWKGSGKDMDRAAIQSAYDGAALVYARNQALAYLGTPDAPGHAEIATFTSDGRKLNMFAHYASEEPDGTVQYHQYPVSSTDLTQSYETHKEGRRWLRNGQDDAKERSHDMRDRLKKHWTDTRKAVNEAAAAEKLRNLQADNNSNVDDDGDVGGKRKAS